MPKLWILFALLLAALPSPVRAQRENEDVHLRNRCRQYSHYLGMGPQHPHYEEALSGIGQCDETGGVALAALWSQMTAADSDAIRRVSYESSRFRDHQLLEGLLTQVADGSRARPVRIGMLSVLVSYYAPGRVLPYGATEEDTDPEYCMLGSAMHFDASEGAAPVTAADRPRILQVLQSLASGDPDAIVRSTAACTVSALEVLSE